MNDEDMPQLRLNPAYKRLLTRDGNDRDTRNYVKERYKSAIQLIKNSEQRKQTIMKVCYSIVARQQDFLERGIDQLKPMMIKKRWPRKSASTHDRQPRGGQQVCAPPQGVFELRYFFSGKRAGPRGRQHFASHSQAASQEADRGRRSQPAADRRADHPHSKVTGHQVTRRTVAKYREDMKIRARTREESKVKSE
jgi:RNA polymerase sigma-54 factor